MLVKLGTLHFTGKQSMINRLYCISASIKMSTGENSGVTLSKVVSILEGFAPKSLAESWDNTGLLVEPYTPRNITKLLLTNDLTEDVAIEANKQGCEMIVAYHPPIFAPLKSVVQSAWKERTVSFLLEKRISLYSPHTSWDCVQGGVNDWLASAFAVKDSKPITPGVDPTVGAGSWPVTSAWDTLYITPGVDPTVGAGRYLNLQAEIPLSDAIAKVKQLTGLPHVRLALAKGKSLSDGVKSVALCAGSGASVLKGVRADLYLTGEMLHHDILDAAQKGISVILTNHSDSERGFLSVFSSDLQKRLNDQVQVFVSQTDKDPLVTV